MADTMSQGESSSEAIEGDGIFWRLPRQASARLVATVARTRRVVHATVGPIAVTAAGICSGLSENDVPGLERLQQSLGRLQNWDDLRRSALRDALCHDWLHAGLAPHQVASRLDIANTSGYLLTDASPGAAGGNGWTDRDLKRVAAVLHRLPGSLKHLPGLFFIVRDGINGYDHALFQRNVDAWRQAVGVGKFKRLPAAVLARLMMRCRAGTSFGTAHFAEHEVRLYNELFMLSRLPGLGQLTAYTVIHEIGHQQLEHDVNLKKEWLPFFRHAGRADAFCEYAASRAHEGYAVGLGIYAVAPRTLAAKSPRTYAFFRALFGTSLDSFHGCGFEGRLIRLGHDGVRHRIRRAQR